MSADPDKLSINQVTTRDQWSLAQAVDGYARHGVRGITVWHDKLRELGVERAVRQIRDAGLAVSGYCVGGLLAARDAGAGRERVTENRRMLDEAAAIGAPALVVIGGGLDDGDRDLTGARARVLDRVGELIDHARAVGVKIALEPLHPMVCANRSVLSTLGQANDWCDRLGADDVVGVAVDTYNVWWDPCLESEIARAGKRIAAFHVADWLANTQDLRLDRGMPGDGVVDIPHIRTLVERAGYDGLVEVEILSERWWARDPDEVVGTVLERYQNWI